MTCKCQFCKDYARMNTVIESGTREELVEQIEYFSDHYWNTDAELDWFQCIRSGSWPTSVDILEKWLENAKKIEEERGEL